LANPTRDIAMLDRVTFELTKKGDAESSAHALAYVKRYENAIAAFRQQNPPPQHFTIGQWGDQMDRAQARALALESRAKFNLNDFNGALESARASWALFPNGDAARSLADIYPKMDRNADAMDALADAFTLEDPSTTEADRAADRAKLGAMYAKANGSGNDLGDLILRAYDRTAAAKKDHAKALAAKDPNALADDIFDFTLPGVGSNPPLALAALRGKVLVMDFWATWCVPCRAQHPILENVKKRFGENKDVVFLALDSDDDLALAAPFLKEQKWDPASWFEGGLERKLMVGSIPTVVIVDRSGKVSSRMIGLIEDRFEQMLTERINDALAVSSRDTASRP
ncbi:MAG TPA: TlpA disulfide reductase family protein, partial [Bryobacteraceae bacterium]|nr:TlpA disulfide reductase family protein [Bryobacteraceae bacterium]